METSNNYCTYNKMIDCLSHTGCVNCGWNPEVAKKRVDRVKRELRFSPASREKSVRQTALVQREG